MKILITAPSLDENENVSGISTLAREIIAHGSGEFSHFAAGRGDGEKAGIGWVVKQFMLPVRFLRRIRREKPDIVHVNTAFVPLSIMRDAALIYAAKIAGIPTLLHLHGGRFLMEDFRSKFLEAVAAKMLRTANMVVVLSEIEKENLKRRWNNLDISILPNAVSTDNILPLKKGFSEKRILFLGRLHESKGLREIIEACEILNRENVHFWFDCFGAGPEKDFFVGEMKRVLGERFFYGGVAAGEKKWNALAESDIFLLPSRYGEGLPIAMLEAMAARCVPVVADVASVRAVIKDGVNGFMVKPYDTAQTAEKLKFLLSGAADWQFLRENARITIEENFSMDKYIEKLERIYEQTVIRAGR